MKKFGILLLSLCIATPVLADLWTNCTNNGGTVIQANRYGNDKGGYCNDPNNSNLTNNCNGKKFCVSGQGMNWWSAFTWCESVGGKLAKLSNLCPGAQTNPNLATGACPNLTAIHSSNSNRWNWTSSGWGNNASIAINLATGGIGGGNFGYGSFQDTRNTRLLSQPAICEE